IPIAARGSEPMGREPQSVLHAAGWPRGEYGRSAARGLTARNALHDRVRASGRLVDSLTAAQGAQPCAPWEPQPRDSALRCPPARCAGFEPEGRGLESLPARHVATLGAGAYGTPIRPAQAQGEP